MKWLDDLYDAFVALDDHDPQTVADFAMTHRLELERAIDQVSSSERAAEVCAAVSHGFAYSGNYAHAIPFALAVIGYGRKEKVGSLATEHDATTALNALVWAHFQLGHYRQALSHLRRQDPRILRDHWTKNMDDLIQVKLYKKVGRTLIYVAGGLMALHWVLRWALDRSYIVVSLIGLALFLTGLFAERWASRRQKVLTARVDAAHPPIRVV
jgi:hypothetical protein